MLHTFIVDCLDENGQQVRRLMRIVADGEQEFGEHVQRMLLAQRLHPVEIKLVPNGITIKQLDDMEIPYRTIYTTIY